MMIKIFVENKIVKLKGKSKAVVHFLLKVMAFRFFLFIFWYWFYMNDDIDLYLKCYFCPIFIVVFESFLRSVLVL